LCGCCETARVYLLPRQPGRSSPGKTSSLTTTAHADVCEKEKSCKKWIKFENKNNNIFFSKNWKIKINSNNYCYYLKINAW
jgi:hypothetical protein